MEARTGLNVFGFFLLSELISTVFRKASSLGFVSLDGVVSYWGTQAHLSAWQLKVEDHLPQSLCERGYPV